MKTFSRCSLTVLLGLCISYPAAAFDVTGGQTNVDLDFDLLESAAGLTLSSVSPEVIAPGEPGFAVAFPINSRSETLPDLSTTFSFDASDFLGSFSGTIEHTGSVFFNADTIELGNFTIGFDAARAMGSNSGFFVESNVGVAADVPVFDVQAPSTLVAADASLLIGADLAVSPELGGFLVDQGLASANLTGAVVGSALVNAVPEPTFAALLLPAGLALAFARRRR